MGEAGEKQSVKWTTSFIELGFLPWWKHFFWWFHCWMRFFVENTRREKVFNGSLLESRTLIIAYSEKQSKNETQNTYICIGLGKSVWISAHHVRQVPHSDLIVVSSFLHHFIVFLGSVQEHFGSIAELFFTSGATNIKNVLTRAHNCGVAQLRRLQKC